MEGSNCCFPNSDEKPLKNLMFVCIHLGMNWFCSVMLWWSCFRHTILVGNPQYTNWFQTWCDLSDHTTWLLGASLNDLGLHPRWQLCVKQNLLCSFSHKFFSQFGWNLACCCCLLLFEADTSFTCVSSVQEREPYFGEFIKKIKRRKNKKKKWNMNPFPFSLLPKLNDSLHLDASYELICFECGLTVDTSQLYSLIPVWITFQFDTSLSDPWCLIKITGLQKRKSVIILSQSGMKSPKLSVLLIM